MRKSSYRVLNERSLEKQVSELLAMSTISPSVLAVVTALNARKEHLQEASDQQIAQIRTLTVERDAANNKLNYPDRIPLKITAPKRRT